nr:protamine mP2 intermediate protein pmP2/32 [mice, Peptide Partial, 10 aa] [Mus sp.]
SPERVEDYGR